MGQVWQYLALQASVYFAIFLMDSAKAYLAEGICKGFSQDFMFKGGGTPRFIGQSHHPLIVFLCPTPSKKKYALRMVLQSILPIMEFILCCISFPHTL